MKITVAGVGYVGLSLAVLLSQEHEVIAVTTTPSKAEMINNFISPIKDEEIEKFFEEARDKKRKLSLVATTDKEYAYMNSNIVIVAVPTDYNEEDNFFDTRAVEDVIERTISVNDKAIIVIKSTVPVGYTDMISQRFANDRIIFSPEFLRESKALYDNLYPSRIIVGASESQTRDAELFANILLKASNKRNTEVLICPPTEAEAIKLFANTFLATRISFFNELDTYCQIKGLNTKSIIDGVCMDPRIGNYYNNPSFGYGGYCLPKDTKQLLANYQGVPQTLIKAVVDSNETRKDYITKTVLEKNHNIVGVFRLTMKSNSDNFRASAIQDIINRLKEAGKKIVIFEPTIENEDKYCGCRVENNLKIFKEECDVILANRKDECLSDVMEKVISRDVYYRD